MAETIGDITVTLHAREDNELLALRGKTDITTLLSAERATLNDKRRSEIIKIIRHP